MASESSWLRSPVVGGFVGVVAGGVTVYLIESLGHALFGVGDPSDLSTITTPMFASVLVAWIVGAAVAAAVATWWTRSSRVTVGVVAGLVLLAASAANLFAFEHPTWMAIGAVVLMPLAALMGARMATRPPTGDALA